MRRQLFEDGCLVTEGKLLRFLEEVAVPGENLTKGPPEDGSVVEPGIEFILQYIKTVNNLRGLQVSKGLTTTTTARGAL